jgi:hypothetical protein
MNDYEAHLSSYDHSHKQRLRDMKAMVRDPNASNRARRAEAKADGMVSIKLAGQDAGGASAAAATGGAGFKKGGFKKSGFKSAFAPVDNQPPPTTTAGSTEPPQKSTPVPQALPLKPSLAQYSAIEESDTEDEGYEVYDPRHPTD